MTRIIEIKFLAQPAVNDEFRFSLVLNGATVMFPGGQTMVRKYFGQSNAPYGAPLGNTLAETLDIILYQLNTFNPHEGITYSISGNSIIVTIVYNGELSVTEMSSSSRIVIRDISSQLYFNGGINTSVLRKAYNNDILTFRTDEDIEPRYATISAPGLNLRLYPDPSGNFSLNLKPYIAALINVNNFDDRLIAYLSSNDAGTYIYGANSGTYLEETLLFTIYADGFQASGQYNLAWFAAVEQPGYANTFRRDELYVLTPFTKETANRYYIKYWQGYPFDFTVYCPSSSLTLKNTGNLLSQDFQVEEQVSRIVMSDGRTDETLENLLPLAAGYNTIRLMPNAVEAETDKFLLLDKVPHSNGVYLKWFNKYGGYSYWLFENTYTLDRSTKLLGELDRDDTNVETMTARTILIGKASHDSIKIITEMLEPHERDIVEGLLDSPKIYLFTGKPFARAEAGSWIEVTLKTTSARLKNARQPLTSFSFDVELPERYTQTL